METGSRPYRILIVDDEWEAPTIIDVVRRIEAEGWEAILVKGGFQGIKADEYESSTPYHIESASPDAVLLDIHFGNHKDDRFRGIQILRQIVEKFKDLPVLVYTRYGDGPDRSYAEESSLRHLESKVDYVDKSSHPDVVILRLRRLIGTRPDIIRVGSRIALDSNAGMVYVYPDPDAQPVILKEIAGAMFEIFRELVEEWYQRPRHVVRYWKFERYVANEQVLRTRIAEIRRYIGNVLGVKLGPDNFIINVRGAGYYLDPDID